MSQINRGNPLIQLSDKVMNLAMKAYYISDNEKDILKVRQLQDIFLDKFKEMTSPKTIRKLDTEAMRVFLNAKLKEKLKK